jgi:hypothetical protein
MTANLGTLDRGIRLVLGIVLIALALASTITIFDNAVMMYGVILLGFVLATTGVIGICPVYSLFGIRTCKT